MDLVIVEWRDIVQTGGWEPHDEVECPSIQSVGWLLENDNSDTIKICNTIVDDDDKRYGITAFPKGCVSKIIFLSGEARSVIDKRGPM